MTVQITVTDAADRTLATLFLQPDNQRKIRVPLTLPMVQVAPDLAMVPPIQVTVSADVVPPRVIAAPLPADPPAGFHEHILSWLHAKGYLDATAVDQVESRGDWDGSTEGGLYSTFGVTIHYVTSTGSERLDVDGFDMENLWRWVVAGWRP